MNIRQKKLKAKKFWRENEHLILLITAAFVVGITTASLNYVTYQNNQNKFQLDESRTITNDQMAEFTFNIEKPSLTTSPTIKLTLSGADTGVPLMASLNGEDVKELTSNSETLQPSGDLLENENTVVIRRTETGFNQQSLDGASVTATTNFQQLTFVVLNLASLLLIVAPILYVKFTQYKARKSMEEKFPEFLRDVVEGTRAGMSLPQAIQNTETGSYGPLDEKIEKMNAQLDWEYRLDKSCGTLERRLDLPLFYGQLIQ